MSFTPVELITGSEFSPERVADDLTFYEDTPAYDGAVSYENTAQGLIATIYSDDGLIVSRKQVLITLIDTEESS